MQEINERVFKIERKDVKAKIMLPELEIDEDKLAFQDAEIFFDAVNNLIFINYYY